MVFVNLKNGFIIFPEKKMLSIPLVFMTSPLGYVTSIPIGYQHFSDLSYIPNDILVKNNLQLLTHHFWEEAQHKFIRL